MAQPNTLAQNDVKSKLKRFIQDNFLEFTEIKTIDDADSFIDNGVIDSTGVLELLEFIEESFEIKVDDDEIIPDNLDSLNSLTAFIERKLSHAGA